VSEGERAQQVAASIKPSAAESRAQRKGGGVVGSPPLHNPSNFPHLQNPKMLNNINNLRGNQRHSEDYGRNVSRAHTQRLYDMMVEAEEAGVEVVVGGSELIDVADRYCPTCIVRVDPRKHSNLRIMNEEIFGGILVFFTVSSDEESIEYVKNVPGTPLAIYVFTSNSKTFERIANSCPSGGE